MSQLSTDLHNGDQLAPHTIEGERATLGSILINPYCLAEVCQRINVQDFWVVRHQWIFEAILRLHDDGMPIDAITVIDRLEQRGKLEEIGGQAYVISLIDERVTSLNVEGYAQMVATMAYRRRLIEACTNGVQLAHRDDKSLLEIHEGISELLNGVAGRAIRTHRSAREIFADELDRLGEAVKQAREGKPDLGWSTGLPELDSVFDGEFRPGAYSVIFGPTKIGKTWMLLQMALAAMEQGPVVFFSLENGDESLRQRMTALDSGVGFTKVRRGTVTDQELAECVASLSKLSGMPFEMVTTLSSVSQIETHLKAATIRHGQPGIAFVDTLNQLADSLGKSKRYEDLTMGSGRLLAAMRRTGWGIVASAQQRNDLSAGMRHDSAKEAAYPTLSSLEGARTITQHVANLIGLYSPDWVARQIHDENYVDLEVNRGEVLLVNVASRDVEGNVDGKLRWNRLIPRYETRGNVRQMDLNDMLNIPMTHAAASAPDNGRDD